MSIFTIFTLYEKKADAGTEITLENLPDGSYYYAVYGDFIISRVELSAKDSGDYLIHVPYENPDAIVFSEISLVNRGDTDGDGMITLIDVVKVLKASVGSSVTLDKAAADINEDASITAKDVLEILLSLLG